MSRILLIFCLLLPLAAGAQRTEQSRKVSDVEVRDLDNKPVMLPNFGQKHLLIFYVDPEKPNMNKEFIDDMEQNNRIDSDNIYGFGVINLKDAKFYPNGLVRKMAAKRTAKNGATVLSDPDHLLRDAWNLGDVNNKFVVMLVTKEGELVFIRKDEFTQEDIDEFYRVVALYR